MKDALCLMFGLLFWLCAIGTPVGCQYLERRGPEWIQDHRKPENQDKFCPPSGLWFSSALTMALMVTLGCFCFSEEGARKK